MLPNNGHSRRRLVPKINQKIKQKAGIFGAIFHSLQQNLGVVPYYDPNLHQEKEEDPLSDFQTFMSLVKCTFGTGILALPGAFKNAGGLGGLIGAAGIGSLVVYAVHVLLNDIHFICERYNYRTINYSTAMRLAVLDGPVWLRPLNRYFAFQVDLFICLYHFGVSCVYVVFIGKNLKILCDIYISRIDTRIYIMILTVPLILIFTIRDMKSLVTFSIISSVLMFVCFCLILKYLVEDLPSLSERNVIQSTEHYPMFFGTVMFSVQPVAMALALEVHMRTPKHYLGTFGVLNRAMFVVILLHAFFGFLGYWKFGDETSSSILYNLPLDEPLVQCIIGLYMLAILYCYALQGYVVVEIIWRLYMKPMLDDTKEYLEYLVRMAIVIASVLCAILTPDFGLLISIVGAFCLAQLGFIYPGVINICTCYIEGYGPSKIFLWRSLFFIVLGLYAGITCSIVSVAALKYRFDDRILLFLSYLHITH